MNYIDDFISADRWSQIWNSYVELGELLNRLGADEAKHKASEPDVEVVCLGTLFNTITMTISMTPDRMVELNQVLDTWRTKVCTNRHESERLIGKIQFVSNCVRQGRVFLNRLLSWLRTMGTNRQKRHTVTREARKDIY